MEMPSSCSSSSFFFCSSFTATVVFSSLILFWEGTEGEGDAEEVDAAPDLVFRPSWLPSRLPVPMALDIREVREADDDDSDILVDRREEEEAPVP